MSYAAGVSSGIWRNALLIAVTCGWLLSQSIQAQKPKLSKGTRGDAVAGRDNDGDQLPASERAQFQAAAEYSRKSGGYTLLVMKRGEVVFEDYAEGWHAGRPHMLASGTKSFSGILALCAEQDGLLKLDERVAGTLTEWQTDDRKSKITIRQLLSLTSGLDGGGIGRPPSYRDAVRLAEVTAEPGEKFQYGPVPFQCFGEVLRRKLAPSHESVEQYLHRRVLDPIGLKVARWQKDGEGHLHLPSGAFLTAREWARFGELIRLKGRVGEKQIFPADKLQQCLEGSKANPAYGLTFWLNPDPELALRAPRLATALRERTGRTEEPLDVVMAAGLGKQRCYIIPSLEMVIVRQGQSSPREFSDRQFLQLLLAGP